MSMTKMFDISNEIMNDIAKEHELLKKVHLDVLSSPSGNIYKIWFLDKDNDQMPELIIEGHYKLDDVKKKVLDFLIQNNILIKE